MPSENYNLEDPAKQEAIRRGHHEYLPTAGKHGRYQPSPWIRGSHNEYPKMLGKYPRPQFADFKGKSDAQQLFEMAMKEWDGAMTASTVKSKAEELAWNKEHG